MAAPTIYEYQGVRGLKAIAELVGISDRTLKTRMARGGLSLKAAIEMPFGSSVAEKRAEMNNEKSYIAVKTPDEMPDLWKLALGIAAQQ